MLSAKDLLTTYHQAEQSQRAEKQYIAFEKRRDKRKQADLDAGRLVRIRIDQHGEEPNTRLFICFCLPGVRKATAHRQSNENSFDCRWGLKSLRLRQTQSCADLPTLTLYLQPSS